MNNQGRADEHTQQVTVMWFSTVYESMFNFFLSQIRREDGPTEKVYLHSTNKRIDLHSTNKRIELYSTNKRIDLHYTHEDWPPLHPLRGLPSTLPTGRMDLHFTLWQKLLTIYMYSLRGLTSTRIPERIDLHSPHQEDWLTTGRVDLHYNLWGDCWHPLQPCIE